MKPTQPGTTPAIPDCYQEQIVLSELERRFYLYLIGGDYERLFYSFVGSSETDSNGNDQQELVRVRLDVEVSESERRQNFQSWCPDPQYRKMLDWMLTSRINARLQQQDDLLQVCPEMVDVLPVIRDIGCAKDFNRDLINHVAEVEWLSRKVRAFIDNPLHQALLGLSSSASFEQHLEEMGYPLFIWCIAKMIGEQINEHIHPSLKFTLSKVRYYGRIVGGTIVYLALQEGYDEIDKWKTYLLAGLSILPLGVLISLASFEIRELINQQQNALDGQSNTEFRHQILNHYSLPGDRLRHLIEQEERLKPLLFQAIGFTNFDPLKFITQSNKQRSNSQPNLFEKARAYAFYRQLYGTGRMKGHETLILLNSFGFSMDLLHQLNRMDLVSFTSHVELYAKYFAKR
ncbi:hypothetical protein IC617_02165 [Neiella sp. HB171785]|uniref:Uncharacterized protein n=1 Tax=Neiella litorisoli TaxID=2771431 RepID=A0A8J6QEQ6_9GAMM|nr:hypothetical protein [Neiella litorisoli]MBD1388224.1 hypothetical protein [Neiella litorisoli]